MHLSTKPAIVFLVLIGLIISPRIYPALTLPLHGDEGSDLHMASKDVKSFPAFFSDKIAFGFDQARFPHVISAVIMAIARVDADNILSRIGIIRLVFLLFHVAYLVISFRLIVSVTRSEVAAYIYVFLLATSCYLSSYSVGIMTTGETAFMLFHILCIKVFYDNFRHAVEGGGVFRQFLLLSLLMALCIASKLFGVLLLVAFFMFHLVNIKKVGTLKIASLHPTKTLLISSSFCLIILLINLIPVVPLGKSLSSVAFGITYVVVMVTLVIKEKREIFEPKEISFVSFWALLAFVSFTLVLVFSPVYLNLRNLLNVFRWFGIWNMGGVAASSRFYDALVIMFMKFGIIPSILLVLGASLGTYYFVKSARQYQKDFYTSFFFLVLVIFSTHLILISSVEFKLVWHSLAIFPFLYLPFVGLWVLLQGREAVLPKYLLAGMLLAVSADNMYRYYRWYPYGHLDGGQYGEKFVGLNKPCFVTFESIPALFEYVREMTENEGVTVAKINVRGCSSYILNSYLRRMLALYFKSKGLGEIDFVSEALWKDDSDLVISSPIYNPEFRGELLMRSYRKIKSVSISNVVVGTVWERNKWLIK